MGARIEEYHRPTSLEEALALKESLPGAAFVAGGTDLLVSVRKGAMAPPPALISLRNVAELTGIEVGDRFRIGAGAPVSDVAGHPAIRESLPALARALSALGSRQIRNAATLGGNLSRASPCADSAPPLLVYEASVELRSREATRELPLVEFFRGPGMTVLEPGEVMTAILVNRPAATAGSTVMRRSRVRMDLSQASVAVLLDIRDGTCAAARVAAGAVGPMPLRLPKTEAALEGSDLGEAAIQEARAHAMTEVEPVTDVRSTEAYRRAIVGVFVARCVRSLAEGGGA